MSRIDDVNKKEQKGATLGDGIGIQQRTTQWLPPSVHEETVLNRMRLAISGATVGHVNDRLATGKQCVGVAKSGSTAAAAEERAATALEEEEAEVLEALAVSVDCRQDIEKLVNEFRRMLTRSVQLKQPRTRTANPPSQRLAEAVCWNCGSSSHYRRSCPLSETRRERRPQSTTGEQETYPENSNIKREYEVGCRAIREEAELNMASNVRISKYGSGQIVAANGERVETVVTAEVDINIGDKLLNRHSMIVARSLSHPCFPDIEFLRPRRALINLGDNKIKLGEMSLKLESSKTQEDQNRGEAQQECGICFLETVTLPAQSEMIVTGRSDRSWIGREGFFEPTPKLVNNYSVMAACSLSCAAGGTVPVRLLNGTDRPITLFRDTKLGIYSTAYTTTSAGCEKEPPRTEPMNKYSDLINSMLQLPRNIRNDIRKQLRALLLKYKQVIATDDYDTGRTNICKHSINTGDTPPIKQNPRRILYHQKESPKKDGSYRFCVGYRKLNHQTKKDAQPLPKIEEILETLSGATWFSPLHLASGYWQVEVADEDKEKTAFTTTIWIMSIPGNGIWPLQCASHIPTVNGNCTLRVTLDDLHDEVFLRLQGAGLKITPTKCQLFQEKVKYLGHIISRDGVQPDPEKIKAVEQWPTPRCVKELQQFLGLASYYRRFVKGFAQLGEPLHRLSEKGKQWNWTDQCEKAFAFLKTQLTKQPVLAHPNFKIPFVVDTDAIGDGLGAVLSQIIAGQERVVAFASRTLSKTERKYCATRREMLALVWALKQFRCFLYGRRFTVRTDHGSLMWLRNFKEPEGQVARWLEQLAEFDFEVVHRPGRKHQNADALSREACKQCGQNTSTPCAAVSSIMGKRQKWEPSPIWPVWTPTQLEIAQEKDQYIAQMRKWVASKTVPTTCPPDSRRALQSLLSQKDQMIIKDGIVFRRRSQIDDRTLITGQDISSWYHKYYDKKSCTVYMVALKEMPGMQSAEKRKQASSRTTATAHSTVSDESNWRRHHRTIPSGQNGETEAYPIPDMTANTIARTLVNEFICRYGAPESLHSDQGRNFEAALIKELFQWASREVPPNTVNYAQRESNNSQKELGPGTPNDTLGIPNKHPRVDEGHALRNPVRTRSRSTDRRHVRIARNTSANTSRIHMEVEKRFSGQFQRNKEKLKTESRRQKKWHDRGTTDYKFNIDDKVWLATPKKDKLDRMWEGPYRILQQVGQNIYKVSKVSSPGKNLIVHVDRLKRWYGTNQPEQETSQEQEFSRPKRAIITPIWLKDYVTEVSQTV
ncbi:Retrovirus-related Pol polyprotein from transposon 17.6 [Trichinella patagoniensis]|uniref:RNA-directed DNA polymerase n=1 Tax=Trichinella patagoniensis TaxID=990121 RepID=A0A0V0ZVC0_9BILA|nr:Retrovirus-related Pol polyprotein from transposon 17.6 [Trichinella patagoniensis]